MKILKYMQIATIVATLGFVSCNNDDIPQIDNGELKIIATIGDDKTRVNTEEDGSKFLPGDSLRISSGSYSDDYAYYVTKNGTVNGIAEFQPTNEKIVFRELNNVFGAEYSNRNIGGGNWYGSYFYATLITQGGVTDQSTVEKLRKFDIMFGKGIVKEGDLIDIASNLGIIAKSGAWYAYEGEKIGQGRENAKTFLATHPEIAEEVELKIRQHYGLLGGEDAEAEQE